MRSPQFCWWQQTSRQHDFVTSVSHLLTSTSENPLAGLPSIPLVTRYCTHLGSQESFSTKGFGSQVRIEADESEKEAGPGVWGHVWFFSTLWTVAHQAPLSMGFSRQEDWNWSWLPFPPPGDLPSPETQRLSLVSPASQADSLLLSHQGSPKGQIELSFLKWFNKESFKLFK